MSQAEHDRIFREEIVPDRFDEVTAAPGQPKAILLGGQPGAGKSQLVDQARQELGASGPVVVLNTDDLRRFHPDYQDLLQKDDRSASQATGPDAGRWVGEAIEHGRQLQCHLVIDGTMREPDVVTRTVNDLREAGYQVEARVLAVPYEKSIEGIQARYVDEVATRGVGRWTSVEAHDAAYQGLPHTLAALNDGKLVDELRVVERDGTTLHLLHRTEGIEATIGPPAVQALAAGRQEDPGLGPDLGPRPPEPSPPSHGAGQTDAQDRPATVDEQLTPVERVREWMGDNPDYELYDAHDVVVFAAKRENAAHLPEGMTARDVAGVARELHALIDAEDQAREQQTPDQGRARGQDRRGPDRPPLPPPPPPPPPSQGPTMDR